MMKILTLLLTLCAAVPALAQVISPAPTQFNTWTPGVTTDGTDAIGATYTVQQGSYVITGSLVVTWFEITVSAWPGTPTGNIVLTGLPIANNAIDNGQCLLPAVPLQLTQQTWFVSIAPNAKGGNFLYNASNVPVSDATNYITNVGPWSISGICWYHF